MDISQKCTISAQYLHFACQAEKTVTWGENPIDYSIEFLSCYS